MGPKNFVQRMSVTINPAYTLVAFVFEAFVTVFRRKTQRLPVIPGALPAPNRLPQGCRFHPRCPMAIDPCRVSPPEMMELGAGRRTRCIRGPELLAQSAIGLESVR